MVKLLRDKLTKIDTMTEGPKHMLAVFILGAASW